MVYSFNFCHSFCSVRLPFTNSFLLFVKITQTEFLQVDTSFIYTFVHLLISVTPVVDDFEAQPIVTFNSTEECDLVTASDAVSPIERQSGNFGQSQSTVKQSSKEETRVHALPLDDTVESTASLDSRRESKDSELIFAKRVDEKSCSISVTSNDFKGSVVQSCLPGDTDNNVPLIELSASQSINHIGSKKSDIVRDHTYMGTNKESNLAVDCCSDIPTNEEASSIVALESPLKLDNSVDPIQDSSSRDSGQKQSLVDDSTNTFKDPSSADVSAERKLVPGQNLVENGQKARRVSVVKTKPTKLKAEDKYVIPGARLVLNPLSYISGVLERSDPGTVSNFKLVFLCLSQTRDIDNEMCYMGYVFAVQKGMYLYDDAYASHGRSVKLVQEDRMFSLPLTFPTCFDASKCRKLDYEQFTACDVEDKQDDSDSENESSDDDDVFSDTSEDENFSEKTDVMLSGISLLQLKKIQLAGSSKVYAFLCMTQTFDPIRKAISCTGYIVSVPTLSPIHDSLSNPKCPKACISNTMRTTNIVLPVIYPTRKDLDRFKPATTKKWIAFLDGSRSNGFINGALVVMDPLNLACPKHKLGRRLVFACLSEEHQLGHVLAVDRSCYLYDQACTPECTFTTLVYGDHCIHLPLVFPNSVDCSKLLKISTPGKCGSDLKHPQKVTSMFVKPALKEPEAAATPNAQKSRLSKSFAFSSESSSDDENFVVTVTKNLKTGCKQQILEIPCKSSDLTVTSGSQNADKNLKNGKSTLSIITKVKKAAHSQRMVITTPYHAAKEDNLDPLKPPVWVVNEISDKKYHSLLNNQSSRCVTSNVSSTKTPDQQFVTVTQSVDSREAQRSKEGVSKRVFRIDDQNFNNVQRVIRIDNQNSNKPKRVIRIDNHNSNNPNNAMENLKPKCEAAQYQAATSLITLDDSGSMDTSLITENDHTVKQTMRTLGVFEKPYTTVNESFTTESIRPVEISSGKVPNKGDNYSWPFTLGNGLTVQPEKSRDIIVESSKSKSSPTSKADKPQDVSLESGYKHPKNNSDVEKWVITARNSPASEVNKAQDKILNINVAESNRNTSLSMNESGAQVSMNHMQTENYRPSAREPSCDQQLQKPDRLDHQKFSVSAVSKTPNVSQTYILEHPPNSDLILPAHNQMQGIGNRSYGTSDGRKGAPTTSLANEVLDFMNSIPSRFDYLNDNRQSDRKSMSLPSHLNPTETNRSGNKADIGHFRKSLLTYNHSGFSSGHAHTQNNHAKPAAQSMTAEKNSSRGYSNGSMSVEKLNSRARRFAACGKCDGCTRPNCRKCSHCLDMKKYGGSGRLKQRCARKECLLKSSATSYPKHSLDDDWDPSQDADGQRPFAHHKRLGSCGRCFFCTQPDCGTCIYCLDKKKFGGPQRLKRRCIYKVCGCGPEPLLYYDNRKKILDLTQLLSFADRNTLLSRTKADRNRGRLSNMTTGVLNKGNCFLMFTFLFYLVMFHNYFRIFFNLAREDKRKPKTLVVTKFQLMRKH